MATFSNGLSFLERDKVTNFLTIMESIGTQDAMEVPQQQLIFLEHGESIIFQVTKTF
jgi:hypothetical protein